ncbi:hypothetical protein [Aeromonas hydrophila]|uniref:hypothetical protein n=1 Tax=Aeromonas hydrophila TaxID=644 RepID=UPI0023604DF5|nr:hypothetical protein [Aeromonas hydrophila]
MMIITNKINIATKYLRQLKKDIRLLTLNMDIIREDTDVVEREFRLLKSKFYLLIAQHEKYRDIAYDIVTSAQDTDDETKSLAKELQDVSDQCRIECDLMNSSFIRIAVQHFKIK